MRKLIIIGYIVSVIWAGFCLDTYSTSLSSDVLNQDSGFIIGYILGMFITTFSPIGAVTAYNGYLNHKQKKEKTNAIL